MSTPAQIAASRANGARSDTEPRAQQADIELPPTIRTQEVIDSIQSSKTPPSAPAPPRPRVPQGRSIPPGFPYQSKASPTLRRRKRSQGKACN